MLPGTFQDTIRALSYHAHLGGSAGGSEEEEEEGEEDEGECTYEEEEDDDEGECSYVSVAQTMVTRHLDAHEGGADYRLDVLALLTAGLS